MCNVRWVSSSKVERGTKCKKEVGTKIKKKKGREILGDIMCNVTRAQTRNTLAYVKPVFVRNTKTRLLCSLKNIVGLCSGYQSRVFFMLTFVVDASVVKK